MIWFRGCVCGLIVTVDVYNVYGQFVQDKQYLEIIRMGVFAAH